MRHAIVSYRLSDAKEIKKENIIYIVVRYVCSAAVVTDWSRVGTNGRERGKGRRTLITTVDTGVTILSPWELNALQGHMYWHIYIVFRSLEVGEKSSTHM